MRGEINLKDIRLNKYEEARLIKHIRNMDAPDGEGIHKYMETISLSPQSKYQIVGMISRYALKNGFITSEERDDIMREYNCSCYDMPNEYQGKILLDVIQSTSKYPERDKSVFAETFLNMRNSRVITQLTVDNFIPQYSHSSDSYKLLVDRYLQTRSSHIDRLYVNKDGSLITSHQIYGIYKLISMYLGQKVSINKLRRRSISKLIDKKGFIYTQDLLGLKYIRHVQRYKED